MEKTLSKISTSDSVFLADSLVKPVSNRRKGKDEVTMVDHLTGKIRVPMVKTADYELDMIIYKENKVEGELTDSVVYEVTRADDGGTFKAKDAKAAVWYCDRITREKHDMIIVRGNFDTITSRYEIISKGTKADTFDFKDAGFKLVDIYDISTEQGFFYGFVHKNDFDKVLATEGLEVNFH